MTDGRLHVTGIKNLILKRIYRYKVPTLTSSLESGSKDDVCLVNTVTFTKDGSSRFNTRRVRRSGTKEVKICGNTVGDVSIDHVYPICELLLSVQYEMWNVKQNLYKEKFLYRDTLIGKTEISFPQFVSLPLVVLTPGDVRSSWSRHVMFFEFISLVTIDPFQ